mmetsp:Transcript_148337/g.413211  ORF Transcript_148337/g.413211 Transcript_148337/m.413211 type:complete len:232 (+) Transcript_148337:388-1083(+)
MCNGRVCSTTGGRGEVHAWGTHGGRLAFMVVISLPPNKVIPVVSPELRRETSAPLIAPHAHPAAAGSSSAASGCTPPSQSAHSGATERRNEMKHTSFWISHQSASMTTPGSNKLPNVFSTSHRIVSSSRRLLAGNPAGASSTCNASKATMANSCTGVTLDTRKAPAKHPRTSRSWLVKTSTWSHRIPWDFSKSCLPSCDVQGFVLLSSLGVAAKRKFRATFKAPGSERCKT